MKEKELTLNEYQVAAMITCMPTSDNFAYMAFNLVGEVGEFASKVAKHIRKGEMTIKNNALIVGDMLPEREDFIETSEEELKKEAGDILWQLAGLCKVMGWSLEEVAQQNLEKLASRKKRGVIDGDGDNR